MTQTIGTNSANDVYLGPDGNIVLLSGIEAVAAACATASKLQLGEAVLQSGLGLPNFQTIWVGSPDYAIWESYLQTTLLGVLGVKQVNSITLSAKNNVLSYTAEIETIFGVTVING